MATEFAKKFDIEYLETSAFNGNGVSEMMNLIMKKVYE